MAKPWFVDFDLSIESFIKIPRWVRLPKYLLHLWLDLVLEAVGEALGEFFLVDTMSSIVFQMTYAHILMEIDVSKGLPEMINLASPNGSWIQLLDYEAIPFRCQKCHKTGHLIAHFSSGKVQSKKSPSWWKGVSDDHYTIQKAPSIGAGLVDSSQDSLVADFFAAPHDLNVSPIEVANTIVPPLDATNADSIISPLMAMAPGGAVVPSGGGASSLVEWALGAICGVDDFFWIKSTGMMEYGLTKVKGKKVKTSIPSFDMSLHSQKMGSKGKSLCSIFFSCCSPGLFEAVPFMFWFFWSLWRIFLQLDMVLDLMYYFVTTGFQDPI